ncbi:esterase SG1-like [Rhagoletis pomonella]|uniref:esterase SG1-like n=1 Tax=Rhagoletis pomonella TaxID=28610 RepID=UPI00177D0E3D|nr:esterase SG1-like [Rhagoletis pomonella]
MHNRLIIILIFYLNVATTKADAPEICIDSLGCIEGIYEPGNEVERYAAFYGVPFAKPPIGELRFKNPVPVEPWNGKLLAKEPHTECTQRNYLLTPLNTTGDEDCLYLNVYRPAVSIFTFQRFSSHTNPIYMQIYVSDILLSKWQAYNPLEI